MCEGNGRVSSGLIEIIDGEEFPLGTWVEVRRRDWKNDGLAPERIAALELIPGWEWDVLEARFQRGIRALEQFVEREGHALVTQKIVENVDGEDFPLGTWVNSRRVDRRRDKLVQERINTLESIPGWTWDRR